MKTTDNKTYKRISVRHINDLTIFSFMGTVDFKEFMQLYRDVYKGNPTKHIIFDTSRGDLEDFTFEQTGKAAAFLKNNIHKRPAGSKTAFIVLGTSDYGTVKTYQIMLKIKEIGLKTEIFHNYRDAIFWLYESEQDE